MAFLVTANEGIFKLPLPLAQFNTQASKWQNKCSPVMALFVPILVHICFTKPIRKLRSKASSSADYSQPPSSTGVIHIGVNHTIETMKENFDLVLQPETRPISQEQLVAEVKGIYAGLVMVEAKCVEVDNKQATLAQADSSSQPKLNNEQWQALIALHQHYSTSTTISSLRVNILQRAQRFAGWLPNMQCRLECGGIAFTAS